SLAPPEAPAVLRSIGEAFAAALSRADGPALRRRPQPGVWSALEYACHVRDVLLVQRDRLYLALVEDTPTFARMHRDERVGLARYNDQDPKAAEDQLVLAAELAARAFSPLAGCHWRQSIVYCWP